MIDYYEQLSLEEQEGVTEVIQTLYRQTFLLEQKYEKRRADQRGENAQREL